MHHVDHIRLMYRNVSVTVIRFYRYLLENVTNLLQWISVHSIAIGKMEREL